LSHRYLTFSESSPDSSLLVPYLSFLFIILNPCGCVPRAFSCCFLSLYCSSNVSSMASVLWFLFLYSSNSSVPFSHVPLYFSGTTILAPISVCCDSHTSSDSISLSIFACIYSFSSWFMCGYIAGDVHLTIPSVSSSGASVSSCRSFSGTTIVTLFTGNIVSISSVSVLFFFSILFLQFTSCALTLSYLICFPHILHSPPKFLLSFLPILFLIFMSDSWYLTFSDDWYLSFPVVLFSDDWYLSFSVVFFIDWHLSFPVVLFSDDWYLSFSVVFFIDWHLSSYNNFL
jgi:hypothetical protein